MNPLAWLQHCGGMFADNYGGVYFLTVMVAMFSGLIGGGMFSYWVLSRFVHKVAGEEACEIVDRGLFWVTVLGVAARVSGAGKKND